MIFIFAFVIIFILLMGASCYGCTGMDYRQKITKILTIALETAKLTLTASQLEEVSNIAQNKSTSPISFGQLTFQFKNKQGKQQRRDLIQRLIVRQNGSGQSIIIYEDSFFLGKIQQGKAHDSEGRLYLLQRQNEIQYILKGKWEKDYFKQGKVVQVTSNRQKDILNIFWNPIKAKTCIKFEITRLNQTQQGLQNQILSYEGQVNVKGKNINEILNGQGIIKFKNGCVYEGTLKNGLMHTEGSQTALFKSQDEAEIYRGHYKQGYKHGFGSSTIKYQGDVCKFAMEWRNGIPVLQTFKLKESFMSSVMRTRYRQ